MGHALTKILAGQRPPRPSGDHEMRQGLWATVKACWRHNPSTRPNAQKVRTFLEEFVSNPRILPTFPPTVDDVESLKSVESSVSTLRRGKGKGRGVGSGGMGIGKEKGKGREVQVGGGGIFSRVQPLGTEETGVFSISFREAQPVGFV